MYMYITVLGAILFTCAHKKVFHNDQMAIWKNSSIWLDNEPWLNDSLQTTIDVEIFRSLSFMVTHKKIKSMNN